MRESLDKAINKLGKWRTVFAGWQLGTRPRTDPESEAVRDHREYTILLRADQCYERRFPGFTTSADGVHIELAKAQGTMKGWRP